MSDLPLSMPEYPGSSPRAPGGAAGPEIETEPTGAIERPESRFSKTAKTVAWIFLGVFSLIFFTLVKLPDDKIKSYIQNSISTVLASRGITMTANESKLSFLLGISYVMKDVTFSFPPPTPSTHVDSIEVGPTLLSLFTGKLGAKIAVKNGDGSLVISGGIRGASVSGSIDAQQFDIGKIGLLKIASDVSGSAVITGKADFSTSTEDLTGTDATIDLQLRKVVVDSQAIQGFTIPKLAVSDGTIEVEIEHGKGQVKTLRLGRPDSATDDIKASITGDLMFGKTLQNSTMNLKAIFSFSDSLMKSFSLLDAILAQGKLPAGGYSYRLQGPILSPNPTPAGGA